MIESNTQTNELRDLLIENNDVVLDEFGNPVVIKNLAVITQDIKHALIEHNILVKLIGQRDPESRRAVYIEIQNMIEVDSRIQPGSVQVAELKNTNSTVFDLSIVGVSKQYGRFILGFDPAAST